MVFSRRRSSHPSGTVILSLVDILRPAPKVAATWPVSTDKNLAEWTAKSIIIADDQPATIVDRALHQQSDFKPRHTVEAVMHHAFDRPNLMSWNAWHHGSEVHVAIKGAPEPLIQRARLVENEHEATRLQMAKMTEGGREVIAIAHTTMQRIPEDSEAIIQADGIILDGLIALEYPGNPDLPQLLERIRASGHRLKIITGETVEMMTELQERYALTSSGSVFDCRQLSTLGETEVDGLVRQSDIYARVDRESLDALLQLMAGDGTLFASSETQHYLKGVSPDLPEFSELDTV